MSDKVKHPVFWTVFLSIVSLAWVYPIVLVLINSFKQKAYISRNAFSLPTGKAFVGLENYIRGIERTNLISSFGWTVVITVGGPADHRVHVDVRLVDCTYEQLGCAPAVHTVPV